MYDAEASRQSRACAHARAAVLSKVFAQNVFCAKNYCKQIILKQTLCATWQSYKVTFKIQQKGHDKKQYIW